MNKIEPSKSSRATCRTCKSKIDKGVARLGVEQEFRQGEDTYTSYRWHHLSCGMDKIPDAVITAEVVEEVTSRGKPLRISDEDLERLEEFREEFNKSGIAIVGVSEIDEANKTVNIEADVLRAMSAATREGPDGKDLWGRTVYVIDDGNRSRINLWEEHAEIDLEKDDKVVVLGAISYMGGNDKIQFHAIKSSTVLVNPDEEDLEKYSENIELYISESWKRPVGEPAEFTIAPTGKASCGHCGDKISKGILKVVKPIFIEIDRGGNKMTVPTNTSFHLTCVINDEDGEEILHEAASRLTLDQISDHNSELNELVESLPNIKAKSILNTLL